MFICYTPFMKKNTIHIDDLLGERQALLQELSSFSLIIKGTFFQRFSTCSRPRCQCHTGKKHGPRSYVTITHQKIQKQVYIPKKQVQAVQHGISQYQRLMAIVARLTTINLILTREGVFHDTGEQ